MHQKNQEDSQVYLHRLSFGRWTRFWSDNNQKDTHVRIYVSTKILMKQLDKKSARDQRDVDELDKDE